MVPTSTGAAVAITEVIPGDHAVNVLAWYDNEFGYAQRVVDLAAHAATSN
jgi:glyceraldehyde-3-phosphate dehydrogenase/erythrose-4-phosphate dehydrogenase